MINRRYIFKCHRIILVLVKGGRDYITPQKAIYTWYISGIYCQLGDYILPTTLYQNLNNPLKMVGISIVIRSFCRAVNPYEIPSSQINSSAKELSGQATLLKPQESDLPCFPYFFCFLIGGETKT